MLDVVQIPLGPYRTNCYLVAREGASEAVVIDPGDDSGTVLSVLADRGWTPTAVLVTHGHSDHLGAVRDVAEASGIEVWIPHDEADDLRTLHPGAYEPEHLLEGGETVSAAGIDFDTMLVPGHSPASIAYHADGHLFSGDVLFAGSVGRTDFPGGDAATHDGEHRPAHGRLPGGDGGAARPRPGHHPRRRASGQPVSGGAPRVSREFQAPRGTLDWYGPRAALRRSVLDEARQVFATAAYGQVVTPTFEDTGVFQRTSGEGSDVVRKEMYSFKDRSDRELTLRPEGTAGVMRAYLEHGLNHLPQPVKVWYAVPMFRYNAVQKGRYREHYQFGAEAIGSALLYPGTAPDSDLQPIEDCLAHGVKG